MMRVSEMRPTSDRQRHLALLRISLLSHTAVWRMCYTWPLTTEWWHTTMSWPRHVQGVWDETPTITQQQYTDVLSRA